MTLEKNQVMKIYIIIILKHHMRVKMLKILIRIIKANEGQNAENFDKNN